MEPLHDETGQGRVSHARYNEREGGGGGEERGCTGGPGGKEGWGGRGFGVNEVFFFGQKIAIIIRGSHRIASGGE